MSELKTRIIGTAILACVCLAVAAVMLVFVGILAIANGF